MMHGPTGPRPAPAPAQPSVDSASAGPGAPRLAATPASIRLARSGADLATSGGETRRPERAHSLDARTQSADNHDRRSADGHYPRSADGHYPRSADAQNHRSADAQGSASDDAQGRIAQLLGDAVSHLISAGMDLASVRARLSGSGDNSELEHATGNLDAALVDIRDFAVRIAVGSRWADQQEP
jgi:hypothetical protein